MPVEAPGNVVAAAPVAARGCLAVVCAGFVWLLNTWLFCAAVGALVVARAACGADCPGVLVLAALSVAATALALALVSFAAALLLGCFVLDPGAREQMVLRPPANSISTAFLDSNSSPLILRLKTDSVWLMRVCQATAIGEAMDGGRRAAMVGKVASSALASIGILAFTVKVYPALKTYERFSTVSLDAAALCTSVVCCFVVIPTFAVRMWRRI
ncbi:unnamed protein product [Urochloa decumbens]|uniref:Uncharacterized protein n=1 Tax=Urochloa decumbens TaxID=240449 RepID=A0ABC9C1R9_9POAL